MLKLYGLPHLVLSVLCAEPLTCTEVVERLDLRYGELTLDIEESTIQNALSHCRREGLAARDSPGRGYFFRTVLTPSGERMLDLLWQEQHQKDVA